METTESLAKKMDTDTLKLILAFIVKPYASGIGYNAGQTDDEKSIIYWKGCSDGATHVQKDIENILNVGH